MSQLTYHVQQVGSGWTVRHAGREYTGYSSGDAALESAINVARKLSLNGHETEVVLEGTDGTSSVVWRSENTVPTIDNMMDFSAVTGPQLQGGKRQSGEP
ncbi:hypothetical protein ACE7GA_25940 [Roseomonas sp. CCTCC AB2023176]|uniref:hypothetical protein n=1 Tax=Roseomonas sp. CCTCC AB2023176 TaxID=3342640 RepID=UPI0035E1DB46